MKIVKTKRTKMKIKTILKAKKCKRRHDLNSETRKEKLYFSPKIKLGPCNFKLFFKTTKSNLFCKIKY